MRAKIKPGSMIGQDFSCRTWSGDDTVFDVTKSGKRLFKCVAPGYGQRPGNYGNGAIYVFKIKDLLYVDGGE